MIPNGAHSVSGCALGLLERRDAMIPGATPVMLARAIAARRRRPRGLSGDSWLSLLEPPRKRN